MSSNTITVGEYLYEEKICLTNIVEFGASFQGVFSTQETLPPQGARFDVTFEGELSGPKLKGKIAGVDYVYMRGDGNTRLHVHAEITTEDGERISFFADGVSVPEEGTGILQIRENVTLHTASSAYSWVNQLQIWAQGTADLAKGEVYLKGYVA